MRHLSRLALLLAAVANLGSITARADSSADGTFVDLTFTGTLVTDASVSDQSAIADQVRYTIGQLNGYGAGARVDRVVISNVVRTTSARTTRISYSARLPVIWSKRVALPATIDLRLPLDVSQGGQHAFAAKYGRSCVDFGAHDVDAGSMFYHFRPQSAGCSIAAADVHRVSATLSSSGAETVGKFPEYTSIWADGALNVVAIFGKYESGAATPSDAGISAYNAFVSALESELRPHKLTTVPAQLPASPGVDVPDIEFKATLADGKKISVVALLTDDVTSALHTPALRGRYQSLSPRADFIAYNGHAGLGANIRAVAAAGKWAAGQYVIVFLNAGDSISFLDGTLAAAHRSVNPDDAKGSRYLDILANGLPAYFTSMPDATMAVLRGLLAYDRPKSYAQILAAVGSTQLPLVIGEQDNAFTSASDPRPWTGLSASATVTRAESRTWSTPALAAGTYTFTITGTGDADLYVRVGSPPTISAYDCRPAKSGSNESCSVTLTQPATIHVMVRGYGDTATVTVVGRKAS